MSKHSITELWYYPIKSFRGIQVSTAKVLRMGFELDRRWMLVDTDGKFLTQRTLPQLAAYSLERGSDHLVVTSPRGENTRIPLDTDIRDLIPVTVWKSRLDAITVDAEIDKFFSDTLDMSVRLVRIPEAAVRMVDPRYGATGDHVSFADAYPVLVTCTASLEDLNRRLSEPIPMNRFRPNIVISSDAPFEEDEWSLLTSREASIRLVKPSDRCVITTTDQSTGKRFEEPLATLATFRKRGTEVYFGVNGIPDAEGTLSVGEPVTVRQ